MQTLRSGFLALLFGFLSVAQAQVVVPDFATRGAVPPVVVSRFMEAFRESLESVTGLPTSLGELITTGIAGSLEPDFTFIIAELGGGRYGVSGEISRVETGGERYAVTILIGDAVARRTSDLLSQPLTPITATATAARLAEAVAGFLAPEERLTTGSAALFVSSSPAGAQAFVDGVGVGETGALTTLALEPGRYEVEVRKEGFLPYTETVDLQAGRSVFVHAFLTRIAGGSIQAMSIPEAEVFLEGEPVGTTPVVFDARPGLREVRFERPGFEPQTLSVLVRNFRVSRVPVELRPVTEPLIFWEGREYLVFIDDLLRVSPFVADLRPGPHSVELRRGRERLRFTVDLPASGAYQLDFGERALLPLE